MEKLSIVFMGTPEFAVASLRKILEEGYSVAGVITAPDKPAGRGRKLAESAVKKFAVEQGLHLLQPTNLKDPDFIDQLRGLHANVFVVVAFRMLPRVVWEMPEHGTFNLHASLLPQYRGAAPINWAVINGETKTGVTTFFINERIDTGEMILQEETDILPDDSAGDVHDRLMEIGAGLVVQTLNLIAKNEVETQRQSESENLKPAPKIHKETCRIQWDSEPERIRDHIRGLSPYPGARSRLVNGDESLDVKIFRADLHRKDHQLPIGTISLNKKELHVAVQGGYIELLEIQLPGKRKMTVREVLNGLKIEKNAQFV